MLQNLVCCAGPSQASPPNCGGAQVLVRALKPRPQVDEHRLHGDHSSQAPCTASRAARVGFKDGQPAPLTGQNVTDSLAAELYWAPLLSGGVPLPVCM